MHLRVHRIFASIALVLLGSDLVSQFPAGYRDTSIKNVKPTGSRSLRVRIYYPATKAGANQPLRAQAGGYPVVVHLHGLGGRATAYTDVGKTLAAAGFIAVLNDTAQFNPDLQVFDGIALFASLQAENKSTTSFFKGALDMKRAGVSGHSMGGGSTIRTLAANPGYKAGFCFAPWDGTIGGRGNSWTNTAPRVRVPFTILHGEGDTIVHWQKIGFVFFTKATNYTGLKTFVLLNTTATHNNTVRLVASPTNGDRAAFARGMAMITGWFDRHLRGSVVGLEQVVGNTVRKGSLFKSIATSYRAPELWRFGSTRIGTTSSLSIGGEPGNAAVYLSPGTKTVTLPFGVLKLDPALILLFANGKLGAPRMLSIPTAIPNDTKLIGAKVWLQGLTDGATPGLQLTDVVPIVIR
jgi:dienelactone hydrolase